MLFNQYPIQAFTLFVAIIQIIHALCRTAACAEVSIFSDYSQRKYYWCPQNNHISNIGLFTLLLPI